MNAITNTTERAGKDAPPVYLTGCMRGMKQAAPSLPPPTPETGADAVARRFPGKG